MDTCSTGSPEQSGLHIEKKRALDGTFLKLAQYDGFEIMRIKLESTDVVWVSPAEDVELTELYCVLAGSVDVGQGGGRTRLEEGDCFYTRALSGDVRLGTPAGAELLYVTNSRLYDGVANYTALVSRMLDPIDKKDRVTLDHSQDVMDYALRLYDQLGSRGLSMEDIVAAALFHDTGKCDTPDAILKKVGRLTEEEYETMKRHPVRGYEILLPIFGENVAGLARAHHERLDGSGYPDGLRGDEIPYGARLIAVADAFDAMTHKRQYNRIKSQREAADELLSLPEQYDQEIVSALSGLVDEGRIPIAPPRRLPRGT